MKKLEVGAPITETSCCACGGAVMIKVGGGKGNLPVGRCTNELENSGLVCGTWFTLGRNAEYALRKRIEEVSNDNEQDTLEHQNDNEAEDSATGEEDSPGGEVSTTQASAEGSTQEEASNEGKAEAEDEDGQQVESQKFEESNGRSRDTDEAKDNGAEADSREGGADNKPVNDNNRQLSLAEKRRAARAAAKG